MARTRSTPATNPGTPSAQPTVRICVIIVGLLTLLAAVLRLVQLDQSPPGLNQDEAINAWNAYSLAKTGADMVGARWPIWYFDSIGDNRTPLFIYWLVPFQWLFGLSVTSMRIAPALSGILCVPLIAWTGARLFGRITGLVAAAVLVANPWHLSSTRWAIDGSIVPFLTVLTLAAMVWAELPVTSRDTANMRPGACALAGAVAGLTTYGYWAIRLQLPVFLALAILLTWRGWRDRLRTRAGVLTVTAFALGFMAMYGPLVHRHVTDPAIAVRASMTRLWEPSTPLVEIARRVGHRYAVHFGPRFLFVSGDQDEGNAPAHSGAFEWAMLPLMLVGLATAAARFRTSPSHAFLLAMVLAYPVGDLVGRYPGVHAFRSSPGMIGLLLLAATGAVAAWQWIRIRSRRWALATALAAMVAILGQDVRSLAAYFGSWRDRPVIYTQYHPDFQQACEWVRPRFDAADAVFWTTSYTNMPFALTLVGLNYDPEQWARDPKDIRPSGEGWHYYVRYGKNYFLYGDLCRPYIERMTASGRRTRVLFVVRPHELGLENPKHVIRGPSGEEVLWMFEEDL